MSICQKSRLLAFTCSSSICGGLEGNENLDPPRKAFLCEYSRTLASVLAVTLDGTLNANGGPKEILTQQKEAGLSAMMTVWALAHVRHKKYSEGKDQLNGPSRKCRVNLF